MGGAYFQTVVSHRPLFNLGVLSGILFSLDLGSFEHLCATPFVSKSHYRKNSMRVVINRNTFTILAKRDDLCNFQKFSERDNILYPDTQVIASLFDL